MNSSWCLLEAILNTFILNSFMFGLTSQRQFRLNFFTMFTRWNVILKDVTLVCVEVPRLREIKR